MIEALGMVVMCCATLLAALVLILRHLAAMRITTGETTQLRMSAIELRETSNARFKSIEEKLTMLNNRSQR